MWATLILIMKIGIGSKKPLWPTVLGTFSVHTSLLSSGYPLECVDYSLHFCLEHFYFLSKIRFDLFLEFFLMIIGEYKLTPF